MEQKPCRARIEFIKVMGGDNKRKFNHHCCLLSPHKGYKHYDPCLLETCGGGRVTEDVNGVDITGSWSPFIERIPLKVHDMVIIYEDPITEQIPEGKACLLHKVDELGDGLERWNVCFEGEDGGVYDRTIKVK